MDSNLQEQYNAKHLENLDGKLSHQDFYEWLAGKIGIDTTDLPCPVQRIAASSDPALNDIQLLLWDQRHHVVRSKAAGHGMKSWSLCDTVCCLKAYGRMMAKKAGPLAW